jgi:hypothetical protein
VGPHHRHRAKRTRHAQPDSTSHLQLEFGLDGNVGEPALARTQTLTLSVIATPHPRLELQADFDVWTALRAPRQRAVDGRGDVHLTGQWTLRTARPGHVAVGVAYEIEIPTANPSSLGIVRPGHRLLGLVSRTKGKLAIDVTTGVDANGEPGGLAWGVEGAVTVTLALSPKFTVNVGGARQTLDTSQPAGPYASAGAAWQVAPRLSFDVGGSLGLSSRAPNSLTAGVTAALF